MIAANNSPNSPGRVHQNRIVVVCCRTRIRAITSNIDGRSRGIAQYRHAVRATSAFDCICNNRIARNDDRVSRCTALNIRCRRRTRQGRGTTTGIDRRNNTGPANSCGRIGERNLISGQIRRNNGRVRYTHSTGNQVGHLNIRVRNVDLFPVPDDAAINRTRQAVNRQNVDKAVRSGQVIATVQQGQARNIRARRDPHNIRAITHRNRASDRAASVQVRHVVAGTGRDTTQQLAVDSHRRIASIIYDTCSPTGAIDNRIHANSHRPSATSNRDRMDTSPSAKATRHRSSAVHSNRIGRCSL